MKDRDLSLTPLQAQAWQGFTYVSATARVSACDSDSAKRFSPRSNQSLLLSDAQVGDRVQIVEFDSPESTNCLSRFDCVLSAELQVLSCTPNGSVIVDVSGKRLGLGAAIAHHIWVMPISPR